MHSTNYFDAFIEVAEDSKATAGSIPPTKEKKTVAQMQYELIAANPYTYTSDEILFRIYAERNDLLAAEQQAARAAFFSKGQACLRASPLAKTYGFGIHFDKEGRVALYGLETTEYERFVADEKIKKVKAMRSKR